MKYYPLISIIIVNYNGRKWLDISLNSIKNLTYKNLEVIVVDNNSIKDEVEYIKKHFSWVKLIEMDENVGFGRANNAGVEICNGSYVFFLNNDTKFIQNNFFELMLKDMHSNRYDLCSPRLLDFDGLDLTKGRYVGADFLGYPGISDVPFYLEGCCLFVSKSVYINLGGFDPAFFMYGEDIDLSWRARIFGYRLGICENVNLLHYGGGTSQSTTKKEKMPYRAPLFRRYESEKNGLRMIIKNYSYQYLILFLPIRVLLIILEGIYFIFNKKLKEGLRIMSSIKWNIDNLKDTLEQKRKIEGKRKVNDTKILKLMDKTINKLISFFSVGKVEVV